MKKEQIIANILIAVMEGKSLHFSMLRNIMTISGDTTRLFKARKLTFFPVTRHRVKIEAETAIELVNKYWGFYDGI